MPVFFQHTRFTNSAIDNSKALYRLSVCNLVPEQTTLSPTTCSSCPKIYELFLSFLHSFGFLKNGILQITRRVLGCKSGESGFGYLIKHKN